MTYASLFNARYGGQRYPLSQTELNAVLAIQLAHKSVRSFESDPVDGAVLELLVAAAQSAPNSSNLQLWSLVAVADPARKQRLAKLAGDQAHVAQAPLLLVWLVDLSRVRRHGAEQGRATDGADYLDAFLTASIDAALAAQNLVTAAESLSLGTVFIGALRNQPLEVASELGLPPGVVAVFGLCIGRPRPDGAEVKPRLAQAAVLHHEQYQPRAVQQETGDYDAILRRFQNGQGLPATDWSRQIVDRLAGPASLRGREQLRAHLDRLGFPLR